LKCHTQPLDSGRLGSGSIAKHAPSRATRFLSLVDCLDVQSQSVANPRVGFRQYHVEIFSCSAQLSRRSRSGAARPQGCIETVPEIAQRQEVASLSRLFLTTPASRSSSGCFSYGYRELSTGAQST
jgi:hypothetical protein